MSKHKKVLMVSRNECDNYTYQAELKGDILVVSTWGSGWSKPNREVGTFDMSMCKVVKYPEDLTDMEALVEAVRLLDPEYGLEGFDKFMATEEESDET